MTASDQQFRIIGHRGANGYVPGNTSASIEKAIDLGADIVEVDVQLTRDQELVIFHDQHLANIEGYDRPITEMTLQEIRELYPQRVFGERYGDERVLTLYELLDQFAEEIPFILELKGNRLDPSITDDILAKLIPVLEDKAVFDQVVVSSSDHELIQEVKLQQPSIATAMIVKGKWIQLEQEIEAVQPDQIHPFWPYVSESLVEQMHQRNLYIFPWTVNQISEGRHLQKIGVDGIFTDYPDRFHSL